jgi:hypothetical protein
MLDNKVIKRKYYVTYTTLIPNISQKRKSTPSWVYRWELAIDSSMGIAPEAELGVEELLWN